MTVEEIPLGPGMVMLPHREIHKIGDEYYLYGTTGGSYFEQGGIEDLEEFLDYCSEKCTIVASVKWTKEQWRQLLSDTFYYKEFKQTKGYPVEEMT